MERTDVREPGGAEEPATTDRAGPACMGARTGAGVARRPEVRRLRTVLSRWDLRQHLYLGRVSQALFVGERCDLDCVEWEDTGNTKLECVAEILTVGSELVRENKANRFLWQQSRGYVTQLITRDNPGTKNAEQSPRSLTKNTFYTAVHETKFGSGS